MGKSSLYTRHVGIRTISSSIVKRVSNIGAVITKISRVSSELISPELSIITRTSFERVKRTILLKALARRDRILSAKKGATTSAKIPASYVLLERLGEGAFGEVMKCRRKLSGEQVAVKVIKRAEDVKEAEDEAAMLKTLKLPLGTRQPSKHIVNLLDSFYHDGHFGMVFDILGPDLYQFYVAHGNPGLPVNFVQTVTTELLDAWLYLDKASIIHGDLKPENILLDHACTCPYTCIPNLRIIDFGLSRSQDTKSERKIQTLPYRAPEALLGCNLSCSADIWSLGCIYAELVMGDSLFPQLNDGQEHIIVESITKLMGPVPKHMLDAGQKSSMFFDEFGELRSQTHMQIDTDGKPTEERKNPRILAPGSVSSYLLSHANSATHGIDIVSSIVSFGYFPGMDSKPSIIDAIRHLRKIYVVT